MLYNHHHYIDSEIIQKPQALKHSISFAPHQGPGNHKSAVTVVYPFWIFHMNGFFSLSKLFSVFIHILLFFFLFTVEKVTLHKLTLLTILSEQFSAFSTIKFCTTITTQFRNTFKTLKGDLYPLSSHVLFPLCSFPWQTLIHFLYLSIFIF